MASTHQRRRKVAEAVETGVLVSRLHYKAKRGKCRRPAKPRSLMEWLRVNATPLTLLLTAVTSLSSGLWSVYLTMRSAPAPTAVVEPYDPTARSPKVPSPRNDKANEPRAKPQDPFAPKIQLLLYGVPLSTVPQPVQDALQSAAWLLQQMPEQQRQVQEDVLKVLTNLGYVPRNVPSALVWKDWRTVEVLPVATGSVDRPAPQTFIPVALPKPSDGKEA